VSCPGCSRPSTRSSHTYRPRHRSADPSAAGSGALWFYPGLGVGIPGAWLAAVGLALLVVLVLVARHESWRAALLTMITGAPLAARLRLLRLTRATLHLLQAPGVLAWTLGISVGSLACTSLALWTTARALSLDLGFLVFLVVLPVITMAALVPSINGIGVRETSMVVVLRGLVPEEQALALAFLFYGLAMLCSALGGVVFLLRGPLGLRLNPGLVNRFWAEH